MQKVTLKYDVVNTYDNPRNYSIEFDLEGMTYDEFLDEIKKFSVLLGYQPETVRNSFPDE